MICPVVWYWFQSFYRWWTRVEGNVDPVWFNVFLTSFYKNRENMAVRKIWVSWRLHAREDKVVQRVQDIGSDGFLLSWRLDRFCVHEFYQNDYKRVKKLGYLVVRNSFWWPQTEKSPNKQTTKGVFGASDFKQTTKGVFAASNFKLTTLRTTKGVLRLGLDEIFVARWFVRFVVSSD